MNVLECSRMFGKNRRGSIMTTWLITMMITIPIWAWFRYNLSCYCSNLVLNDVCVLLMYC